MKLNTRNHKHEVELNASAEKVFGALISPAAICKWWGASSAIIVPKQNGIWIATWGDTENPDYITAHKMTEYEYAKKIVFDETQYVTKFDPPPFELNTITTFEIEDLDGEKCILKVTQDGFPSDSVADDFYHACEVGWKNTFDGMKRYIDSLSS